VILMPAGLLSAAELLDAASVCRSRSFAEAALYLATLGRPDLSWEKCAELPIGQRDGALVAMRAAMFGPQLSLGAACPNCRARLDVSMTTDALAIKAQALEDVPLVLVDGRIFGVRPADSRDLAMLAAIPDSAEAREVLALRCLLSRDGGEAPPLLTPLEVSAIAAAVAAVDPAGDPYVSLSCAACGTSWEAPVDISQILAADIEDAAKALVGEVHELASAYHWSEQAILAMTADRRHAYLQLVRT
jgi:hypothetical protein